MNYLDFTYQVINKWQLCPKCSGSGFIDAFCLGTKGVDKCNLCNGKMVISRITGQPPSDMPDHPIGIMTTGSPIIRPYPPPPPPDRNRSTESLWSQLESFWKAKIS